MDLAISKGMKNRFEEALHTTLEKYRFTPSQTFDAARYALFGGGKRVRPLLFLKALESYHHPLLMEPAISLEFIHTYSLIHDDLPAMDNDDFRRGKPTVHKVFPESIAILAGDFLLTAAFEILATTPCPADKKVELIRVLSKAAGMHGMIGGQTMDILGSADLLETHRLKTGALMGAALEMAAILLDKDRSALKELGERLGILFQIKNDQEDVRESDKKRNLQTFAHVDPAAIIKEQKERIDEILDKHERFRELLSLF